jgi:hypothetical protein
MSIQLAKAKKFHNKVFDKTGFGSLLDQLSQNAQKTLRYFGSEPLKVYYHYHSRYTHPHIRNMMYGRYAPVRWQNYKVAKVAHFLQQPQSIDKPYLIEPNDHILTLGHWCGAKKPSELINRIDDIKEIIASSNFKGFLLGPDGLIDQYQYYFGNEYRSKLWLYPQARIVPKIDLHTWTKKNNVLRNKPINFISLAGDYQIKAVDILIEAWLSLKQLNGATLTIVCSNIPNAINRRLLQLDSVRILPIAPLNAKLKADLLSQADVSIGLTHIDGGANLAEGMEYGHAIITNTCHRSSYFVSANNAQVVVFPNEYYKPGRYGVAYDSVPEYLGLVEQDKRAGKYDQAKTDLAAAMLRYIEDPDLRLKHSQATIAELSAQNVWKSNVVLREIYMNAIKN